MFPGMGAPPRTRLPTDERRAQLLALGRSIFNERAYDEVSIDDIAAAASISKGLLYHYFPNKKQFYVEVVRAAADELIETTAPVAALPPDQRLAHGLDAYLEFVDRNARAYVTLMRSGVGTDEEVAAVVEGTREALVQRILVEGLGMQAARPLVRLALRGWIGLVEAVSLDWIDRRELDRAGVRALLAASLVSTLGAVAALDPESGLPGPP